MFTFIFLHIIRTWLYTVIVLKRTNMNTFRVSEKDMRPIRFRRRVKHVEDHSQKLLLQVLQELSYRKPIARQLHKH